ncbi:hypothetical protein Apa02nite_070580 [Actinoplanes palleronii]|uniref:Uncharacterized protein n=1 Tax=Actinoplanes palleronii TaxID=113570 RepID=A0ABQ4BJY9_9ACTN|nr:hypothetical protein Apa02nite_070580 [Actinoplanes palleronii]
MGQALIFRYDRGRRLFSLIKPTARQGPPSLGGSPSDSLAGFACHCPQPCGQPATVHNGPPNGGHAGQTRR